MSSTRDDPWSNIKAPADPNTANGVLISPDLKWKAFWMRNSMGDPLMAIPHAADASPSGELPELSGVSMEVLPQSEEQLLLLLRLLDENQKEIFEQLCLDIANSMQAASTESGAMEIGVRRAWRWHKLLRGSAGQKLPDHEQMGLIGELRILQELMRSPMGISTALESWTAPEGTAKDFEVGACAIEVKANRSGAHPTVQISSEFQLDIDDFEHVYLVVASMAKSADEAEGVSLFDVVGEVRDEIDVNGPGNRDLFELKVNSRGYSDDHDYSAQLWLENGEQIYLVSGEFPRIESSEIRPGVSRLKYEVDLNLCSGFLVQDKNVAAITEEATDG